MIPPIGAARRAAVPEPVVHAAERQGLDGAGAARPTNDAASASTWLATTETAAALSLASTVSSTSRVDRLEGRHIDADFLNDL